MIQTKKKRDRKESPALFRFIPFQAFCPQPYLFRLVYFHSIRGLDICHCSCFQSVGCPFIKGTNCKTIDRIEYAITVQISDLQDGVWARVCACMCRRNHTGNVVWCVLWWRFIAKRGYSTPIRRYFVNGLKF